MTTKRMFVAALAAVLLSMGGPALAQYNAAAGQNAAPPVTVDVEVYGKDGRVHHTQIEQKAPVDHYGNAAGTQNDLAVDGAFDGQTIVVLHFYTMEGFDFSLPKEALKEKGFSVYRYVNAPPSPAELKKSLEKANQLWIISGDRQLLNKDHLKVIKEYFDAGHGVYIWGDNEPYYADANFVAEGLFGVKMLGNLMGNNVVGLEKKPGAPGLLPHHLLTTGIEFLFEGITIATIQPNQILSPLVYGSAGNWVTGVYDKNGKRAIVDGGFTRLYIHWDTAGTARYVKNSAAWLANAERFGDKVVSTNVKLNAH